MPVLKYVKDGTVTPLSVLTAVRHESAPSDSDLYQTAYDDGYAEGCEVGNAEGYETGYAEGYEVGLADGAESSPLTYEWDAETQTLTITEVDV